MLVNYRSVYSSQSLDLKTSLGSYKPVSLRFKKNNLNMKFWWFQFEYLVIVLYFRMVYQVLVKILFVLIPNQVDLNLNVDFEIFDSREHI